MSGLHTASQDLWQMSSNLPHHTCASLPTSSVSKLFLWDQNPRSCRVTCPACFAVHLDSSTESALMSIHTPLSLMLAACQQRDAQCYDTASYRHASQGMFFIALTMPRTASPQHQPERA